VLSRASTFGAAGGDGSHHRSLSDNLASPAPGGRAAALWGAGGSAGNLSDAAGHPGRVTQGEHGGGYMVGFGSSGMASPPPGRAAAAANQQQKGGWGLFRVLFGGAEAADGR